jgi:small subunit ribosomal protein S8
VSKDVIADFLTVIRNGVSRSKSSVVTSHSKLRYEIAQVLKQEGFISDVVLEEESATTFKNIKIVLKYVDGESAIHEIVRVSKPSRRIYTPIDNVKPVIGGLGVNILTTSKGVMTDKVARHHRVGGELMCTIW